MILLLWFFVCCFLAAAIAVLLRFLLRVVQAVSFMAGFLRIAIDCCEERRAVKFILSFEASSRAYEEDSSCVSVLSRGRRVASRKYETLGTGFDFSGEDFQNMGTFIVVRSSVFAVNSVQKMQLARDAHSAFWVRASGCQDEKRHYGNRVS